MVRPLHDQFLVKRTEPADVIGLIVVPDTAKWRGDRGTVRAVGPGKKTEDGGRIPLTVQVGDVVMLPEYAGVEVRVDGELLALMREDDVLGILTADAHAAR